MTKALKVPHTRDCHCNSCMVELTIFTPIIHDTMAYAGEQVKLTGQFMSSGGWHYVEYKRYRNDGTIEPKNTMHVSAWNELASNYHNLVKPMLDRKNNTG